MYSRGKSIGLLAIICFFANTIKAEERIAYKKHWDFPSGLELFFDPRSYEASDEYQNLTYVICDKPDDLQKSERNCTAVQDTQPERSCPVTLKNFRADGDELAIYPFGSTRAVIFWSERYSLSKRSTIKCIILDFGTCESKDVLLEESFDRIRWTYFVAYEDSFDLVTISSTINNGHNKYHVDVDGNVTFSSWKNYLTMEQFASATAYRAITADSELKAYLHFGKSFFDVSSTITSLVKPDGWRKVLVVSKKYSNTAFIRVESTAHETIGIAYALTNVVEVSQFDQEGELKLNTSVSYDVKEVKSLALRNLADGGFLLWTIGSSDGNPDAYYLTKVDAQGKVVGTIKKEPEPNCAHKRPSLRVFDNEAKEHCFVIVCHDHGTLDLVVKCFGDEDFSDNKTVV
ncbi:uncharacterized protein LOC100122991 [Nasonia vitripennis]|uniref:Uncharacterized protein n=1 Tax=Nasonia vitripennis TaxID=7425 RepID=A0A7M7IWD5_NASVI|nr:uncharacterized protein LOC100122991 [Nasonia vitripennis]XP_031786701.1 uncharacterized protein LOC100122991 [Nasonia vitripennis]XP_032455193.1 uncharacterized protein LOC100122991 [Nasonia vitripennis]